MWEGGKEREREMELGEEHLQCKWGLLVTQGRKLKDGGRMVWAGSSVNTSSGNDLCGYSLPLIPPQAIAVPDGLWRGRSEDGGWGEGSCWHIVEEEEEEAEEEAEGGKGANVSSGKEK